MAITMIAPMSSAMASASRNSLSHDGARVPSMATTPVTIAMSVAIGMPHPFDPLGAGVEHREDQRGNDHPAERGDDRQRRLLRVAELALRDLALDLESGDEEEQHHRHVVDPGPQVERDLVIADADHGLGVPEIGVAVGPRRVGPHHGNDRGGHEQHAGARLGPQEVGERADETVAGRSLASGSSTARSVFIGR